MISMSSKLQLGKENCLSIFFRPSFITPVLGQQPFFACFFFNSNNGNSSPVVCILWCSPKIRIAIFYFFYDKLACLYLMMKMMIETSNSIIRMEILIVVSFHWLVTSLSLIKLSIPVCARLTQCWPTLRT